MKTFFADTTFHASPYEIFNGEQTPHQEVPSRVTRIFQALEEVGIEKQEQALPVEANLQTLEKVLAKIHHEGYLQYLKNLEGSEKKKYLYPSVFPYRDGMSPPEHSGALLGFYSFDMYTPVHSRVYEAAILSASCAQEAARHVLSRESTVSYALCRPPGHHAERAKMGGYCYLNNAAVAAETLREHFDEKIAILDVDFHQGNGAEQIFSHDKNTLTISIHADPKEKFPFFSGGVETSFEANRNFPLPLGTTDQEYERVLSRALEHIHEFQPRALVVAYGADTHVDDPIGGFQLSTKFYTTMGKMISELKLPTVITQEGGYNTAQLGKNVVSFLSGFSN